MDAQFMAVVVAFLVLVITFIICFLRNSKERTYEEVYGQKNLTAALHGGSVKSTKSKQKKGGKREKKDASESGSISGDARLDATPATDVVANTPVNVKVERIELKKAPGVTETTTKKTVIVGDVTATSKPTVIKSSSTEVESIDAKAQRKAVQELERQLQHAQTRLDQTAAAKAKLETQVKQLRDAVNTEKVEKSSKIEEERSRVTETENKLAIANSILDVEKQKALASMRELETVKQALSAQALKQNTDHQNYRQAMAANETEKVKLAAENARLKTQLATPPIVQQKVVQPALQAVPAPTEDLSKPLALAKKQVAELKSELAGERQAASQVQSSFDKLSQVCERLRNERDENDNRLSMATKEIANKEKMTKENVLTNGQVNGGVKVDTKKYTDKIETLETSVSELTQKLAFRNVEVASLKENVDRAEDTQRKVAQLQTELDSLTKSSRAEIAKSETGLKEELTKARTEAAEYKELAAKLERDVVTELRSEVASLSKQLADMSNVKHEQRPTTAAKGDAEAEAKLRAEVEKLTAKNEELRARNYAAVAAVIEAEKTSQRMLADSKAAPAPSPKAAKAAPSTNGTDANVAKLQSEVVHYKTALESLASTLTSLESAAASELEKWQHRCEELERHTTLRDTVETTVVLKEIEKVRDVESERQYAEVREQLTVLQAKLKDDAGELATTREQLRILTDTLETERSTGRDLSQQAVKLRGMLKVGQEALKHEQHTVTTLREQLRVLQA